jgi:uncharacterized protein (DUF433 family)
MRRVKCQMGLRVVASGDEALARGLPSSNRTETLLHGADLPRLCRLPSLHVTAVRGTLPYMSVAVLSRDPEVMGGTAVFPGTRVPVQTLLDYLEAGESIDDFLAGFPSVKREQLIAFLEAATERLVAASS